VLFKVNLKKAASQGALARESSGRTLMQSIWHYIIEFDGKPLTPYEHIPHPGAQANKHIQHSASSSSPPG
jgi:hypothetical protein